MEVFLAMIAYFGFNWTPDGWALCNGQTLSVIQNQALFSLMGVIYSGDGQSTFGLPDLRGRVVLGQGISSVVPHTNYTMGNTTTGVEALSLTTAQMPAHNHAAQLTNASATIKANSGVGSASTPSSRAAVLAGTSNVPMYTATAPDIILNVGNGAVAGTVTVAVNGNSSAVSVMQPYCVLNACIATQGLYPMRP